MWPNGSTEVANEPAATAYALDRPFLQYFFAAQVDHHAFWTTDASPDAVIGSVSAHVPAGAKVISTGYAGPESFAAYDFATKEPAVLTGRQLVVEAVP